MAVADGDDVTNGELHRRLTSLESDVKGMGTTLVEIKTALAGQGVKVGVVWSAMGLAGAAPATSLTGLIR